ncbi:MAG TPA: class I SAM-dependent methyltransferase [Bryobacteraceae bacterium]|jgi:ubiquinone/menaquinone biosynthesis C-methylase UbiE
MAKSAKVVTNQPARDLERVRKQWTTLGERDPLWAILSRPDKQKGGWDRADFFKTGVVEVQEVLDKAQRLAPVNFNGAVDFGCGVGRLSQALSAHFQRVVGIDIAESMILQARELNGFPERCEYIHNVAADLSILEDGSADFIYSNITLQHVVPELARRYIREFFRVSRPGGHVIFQLPSRPRSRVWHAIKSVTPVAFANWIWRLRTSSPEAMETYSMKEEKVIQQVKSAGGAVLSVENNQEGPDGWQSRRYFCVRPQQMPNT